MESEGVPAEGKAQKPALTRICQYTHKTFWVSIWQEIQTVLTTEKHCQLLNFFFLLQSKKRFLPFFFFLVAE